MPTYTMRHKKTGHSFEIFLSISEGDAFVRANPEYERLCGAPACIDSIRLGITKPDGAFRNRLKEIKKHHGRRSTIKTGNLTDV